MHAVREFLNKNKGIYVFAVSVFAAGIVLGTAVACGLGGADNAVLKEQLSKYVSYETAGSVTFRQLMTSRCTDSLRYILVMALCAQHVALLPVAAVCLGIKGYQLGFAVSFVCGNFGGVGVVVSVISSLFSYIVAMPFYILVFAMVAAFVAKRKHSHINHKGDLGSLCAVLAVVYGILCLTACAEGFLIPLFVSFFSA